MNFYPVLFFNIQFLIKNTFHTLAKNVTIFAGNVNSICNENSYVTNSPKTRSKFKKNWHCAVHTKVITMPFASRELSGREGKKWNINVDLAQFPRESSWLKVSWVVDFHHILTQKMPAPETLLNLGTPNLLQIVHGHALIEGSTM